MEKLLTIASFNIQNYYMKKDPDRNKNLQELIEIIKREKIDILCCQEVLEEEIKILEKELNGYTIIGNYRYGKNIFSKKIQLLKKYNEATPIITNRQILKANTYQLPWIPNKFSDFKEAIFKYRSITPRILTEAMIKIDSRTIVKVWNTHLEKKIKAVKKKQMRRIIKQIKNTTYPSILTGDFNMGINHPEFQKLQEKLEKLHLKRVDFNTKTLKKSKTEIAIDHLFIPDNFEVIEQKRIDNSISDHYMILVKIRIN